MKASLIFIAVLTLSLVSKESNGCTLNDIHVAGARTENVIEGKPEWKVTVSNGCGCSQWNIKLACKGFQTTEPIDKNILMVNGSGDECLFLNGNSLNGSDYVTFYYAWDTPFVLIPVSSTIDPAC